MSNSKKEDVQIKRKSLDPKLLNYLNYLNKTEKGRVVLPATADTLTGEIGKLESIDFPVNSCLYYHYFTNHAEKTYWRVERWYRWKELIFQVDVLSATEIREISYPVNIKEHNEKSIQTLFDVPELEYNRIRSSEYKMSYDQRQANLLDFYKSIFGSEPAPQRVGERRFRKAFETMLNTWFEPPNPLNFDADGEKWYEKIII